MKYEIKTIGTATPPLALSSKSLRETILDAIEKDHDLKDYLDELQDEVEEIKATKLNKDGSLIWEVNTNKVLNKKEEKNLTDYLTGQCSDGWGEGFEQNPILIKGNNEYYYSPWKSGSRAKIISKK